MYTVFKDELRFAVMTLETVGSRSSDNDGWMLMMVDSRWWVHRVSLCSCLYLCVCLILSTMRPHFFLKVWFPKLPGDPPLAWDPHLWGNPHLTMAPSGTQSWTRLEVESADPAQPLTCHVMLAKFLPDHQLPGGDGEVQTWWVSKHSSISHLWLWTHLACVLRDPTGG